MKTIDAFTQNISPILRLSASRYSSLIKCNLKEIWSSNQSLHRLLPLSPETRIGTITHKVLEMAVKGLLGNENEILQCWENEVRNTEDIMRHSELEQTLVPLSKSSKNYELKRFQTKLMAGKIIQYVRYPGILKSSKSKIETFVESKDKKIVGKIDLVRYKQNGVQIIDYKTGLVAIKEGRELRVKDEYRMQMILYAALYQSKYDEWPVQLTLISLDGNEHDVDYEPNESLNMLRQASDSLDKVNKILSKGCEFDILSRPSASNCKYCPFRPACSKYWKTRSDDGTWPLDVSGTVESMTVLGNGLLSIVLSNKKGGIVVRGLNADRWKKQFSPGNLICACNLKPDSIANHYIATPLTACYEI